MIHSFGNTTFGRLVTFEQLSTVVYVSRYYSIDMTQDILWGLALSSLAGGSTTIGGAIGVRIPNSLPTQYPR